MKEIKGTVRATNAAFFTLYRQVREFAEFHNLPISTRQASKFRNKKGQLYHAWRRVMHSLNVEADQ